MFSPEPRKEIVISQTTSTCYTWVGIMSRSENLWLR